MSSDFAFIFSTQKHFEFYWQFAILESYAVLWQLLLLQFSVYQIFLSRETFQWKEFDKTSFHYDVSSKSVDFQYTRT